MRGRFPTAAQAQARAMLAVLERDRPGAAALLRQDPLAQLRTWSDIRVVLVAEHNGGDGCSVSGSYHPELTPPALLVGRSLSLRRRGFTALHELGHHLQQTDIELGERTFDFGDSVLFQEEACDAFAAQVLLPDDWWIGSRGPTAQDVVDLFDRSAASREACCVSAARHLAGAGVVVLYDAAGTVLFAAPRGFVPPARRSDQSATPLIAAALRTRSTATRDETFVVYRNGTASAPLYGQAAWCGENYLIAVLASDNVAWLPFAPPRPSVFDDPGTCETELCDKPLQFFEPACERCRQRSCEDGHCGCVMIKRRQDRLCRKCFLMLAPARFDGPSLVCLDCG